MGFSYLHALITDVRRIPAWVLVMNSNLFGGGALGLPSNTTGILTTRGSSFSSLSAASFYVTFPDETTSYGSRGVSGSDFDTNLAG